MRKTEFLCNIVAFTLLVCPIGSPALSASVGNEVGAAAQPPAVQESPAMLRAMELLQALQSRDMPTLKAFVEKSFAATALKSEPADDRAQMMFEFAADVLRGGSFVRWDKTSETEASLVFRNDLLGRLQVVGVKVEPSVPHGIVSWTVPEDLPNQEKRPGSDREVAARLDALAKRMAKYDYFSGAMLLMKGDKPILASAYGLAERNFSIPNRLDTRFQIASMGKQFTAVAIAQLVEQGKLSLDDPLSKFVPGAPGSDRVLIKHLLSHTSGLGDAFNGSKFFEANPRKMRFIDDYIAVADTSPLRFEPGKRSRYSNLGYLYLGKVIEAVSGRTFYDYVTNFIFKPAGMANTRYDDFDYAAPNMAYPYEYDFDRGSSGRHNTLDRLGVRGQSFGGTISTVEDIGRFARALRSGVLLKPATLEAFTAPRPELSSPEYGYGFEVLKLGDSGITTIGHQGNAVGVCSNLMMFDHNGKPWTFVVISNSGRVACMPLVGEAPKLLGQLLGTPSNPTQDRR